MFKRHFGGLKLFSNTFRIVFRILFFAFFKPLFSYRFKSYSAAVSFCRHAALRIPHKKKGPRLRGTAVAVLQSRCTMAIVYRLMFFLCHKGIALYPPRLPPKVGYSKMMLEACCYSIAAQAAISFLLIGYRAIGGIVANPFAPYRGQKPQNREKRVSESKNPHFPPPQKRASRVKKSPFSLWCPV